MPTDLTDIINIMIKVTTSWVFWGGLMFWMMVSISQIVWTSGNAERRKQAGPRLFWAVVGLFVVLSIGGIVAILNNTLFGQLTTP